MDRSAQRVLLVVALSCAGSARATRIVDLAEGADLVVHGAFEGDGAGSRMAGGPLVADADGDGVNDLVTSSEIADRPDGACPDAGAVDVLFGPLGRGAVDLALPQPNRLRVSGGCGAPAGWRWTATGDGAGSFALGDVSGDGVTDLVVGAPHADGPSDGRRDAGQVHVVFGPLAPGDLDLESQPAHLTLFGRAGATVPPGPSLGDAGGDLFGWSVATADVNGDGRRDLVVSAPGASGPSGDRPHAGEVDVFFGPLAAGTWDLATTPPDAVILGRRSPVAGPGDGGRLGCALRTGDITGDGVADLVIGAPEDGEPPSSRGVVEVLPGPVAAGLTDLDSDARHARLLGTSRVAIGWQLAIGDVSGDGVPDLLMADQLGSAPAAWRRTYCGAGFVVHGPVAPGSQRDLGTDPPDVEIYGGDGDADPSSYRGDGLAMLTAADLDGDGADEMLVAMFTSDGLGGTRPDSGTAHVFAGPVAPGAIDMADPMPPPEVTVLAAQGGDGAVFGDGLGLVVAGDATGDGVPDLVAAALMTGGPSGDRHDAGTTYVVSLVPPAEQQVEQARQCFGVDGAPLLRVARDAAGAARLSWTPPTDPSVLSDAVGGDIPAVAGAPPAGARCIGSATGSGASDVSTSNAWYLVRSRSDCATGPYGRPDASWSRRLDAWLDCSAR